MSAKEGEYWDAYGLMENTLFCLSVLIASLFRKDQEQICSYSTELCWLTSNVCSVIRKKAENGRRNRKYLSKLWQTALKFQWQFIATAQKLRLQQIIHDFRSWRARQKCSQVTGQWQTAENGAQNVYITTSGCRSLSQSPEKFLRALHRWQSRIFNTLCHNSGDIRIFSFGSDFRLSVICHVITELVIWGFR